MSQLTRRHSTVQRNGLPVLLDRMLHGHALLAQLVSAWVLCAQGHGFKSHMEQEEIKNVIRSAE